MASRNPQCLISFSIATIIIGLALTLSCEAKHLKTLSQTPKSYLGNNPFLARYNLSMQGSIAAVSRSFEDFSETGPLLREPNKTWRSETTSCRQLLSLASYNLNLSLLTNGAPTHETLVDFNTYLCGTLSYIETCLDEFEYAPVEVRNMVFASLDSSRKNVSNSLSILSTIDASTNGSRKPRNVWPPSWMSSVERKILFDSNAGTAVNVVVAKDGSGRFKTISEAISVAPQNSNKRFVIYVKQGVYYENVKIDQNRINIMMYGDGMDKTIVSGKRSQASGSSTVDSATFAVYGRGFIARDIGFENTAGPSSHQAVALLSVSDNSVFYKCSISGYQDTLFSFSGRQFYRECRISGTIDFIFGHSSTVFQSCTIAVRKPLPGQSNTITAQGNPDRNCQGGFSIDNCDIIAAEDFAGVRTFLGRPWQSYATVVFMKSSLGRLIDPQGWSGWKVGDAPPDTAYFREYGNTGPGSATGRKSMSVAEAQKFTVKNFIGGVQWLPPTGVPFQPDL